MSPRAAWRLEAFGYSAYDYVAGKEDWLSYALPREGEAILAGDTMSTDVPTCGPDDRVSDVRGRFPVVVLNRERIVVGLLREDASERPDARVEDAMREGPTTVRPSEILEELVHRMQHADVDAITVTSSDGRLLGVLDRSAGERHLDDVS